ncbi:mediator of RNA polymerase II transcription subunit 18 isoform X2 [Petromyzon marinus]|uniref:Mediator of RNA polymerase II transcription subunit 18 n=1 Tax=Petromyzon marinus TaxID=7757 RepID=S4RD57_PETMA|nr:mediator of RNA polymerase II transcription subunit 18 [Petromyzon marinus]
MEEHGIPVQPLTGGGGLSSMEYLLQGSVLDSSVDNVLSRLRGLCDNMEAESFADHEIVFLLKPGQGSPFVIRARHALDRPGLPWQLRYVGTAEVGDKQRGALVRSVVEVAASECLPTFLQHMGFRTDHEYIARGHIYRKGTMKVVVCKVFRLLVAGSPESAEPLSPSHLLELSVVCGGAGGGGGADAIAEDMRSFAEQLKPLVQLDKVDPKRL